VEATIGPAIRDLHAEMVNGLPTHGLPALGVPGRHENAGQSLFSLADYGREADLNEAARAADACAGVELAIVAMI
jgi:hypothetical protein